MFFRNLSLFRFPESVAKSLKHLAKELENHRLRECGPLEPATRGFISPYGRNHDALSHASGAFTLLAIGSQERLLPGVVVAEEVAERIDRIAAKQGRRPGAKERKRLKEEVISEFLPRAFVRPSRLLAYLDGAGGWFVIDSASRKAAEDAVSQVREALGRFPAVPVSADESARTLMTAWLIDGQLPAGLALGEEIELRDPAEAGAVVRCRRQDLESDEIRGHLKAGKQVFQLGLVFRDRASFVLGEDLCIRKLRFLDVVLDTMDPSDAESAEAELAACFTLMTLELKELLAQMEQWFDIPRPGERD